MSLEELVLVAVVEPIEKLLQELGLLLWLSRCPSRIVNSWEFVWSPSTVGWKSACFLTMLWQAVCWPKIVTVVAGG